MEVSADQWRPSIVRLMAGLRGERQLEMFTTNWTLYEALSIARRHDPRFATTLHDRARTRSVVVQVGDDIEREAVKNFLGWRDKKASVVDHANTLAAVRNRCEAIISFDRDFIPLAAAAGLRVLR